MTTVTQFVTGVVAGTAVYMGMGFALLGVKKAIVAVLDAGGVMAAIKTMTKQANPAPLPDE